MKDKRKERAGQAVSTSCRVSSRNNSAESHYLQCWSISRTTRAVTRACEGDGHHCECDIDSDCIIEIVEDIGI
jgi:hypothetical protein